MRNDDDTRDYDTPEPETAPPVNRPLISDGPAAMTDAQRLDIALGRLAEAETRAAFQSAGARGPIHKSVLHRVRAKIDSEGRLIVDATGPDGSGVLSLAGLVDEIKAEVPGVFETRDPGAPERPSGARPPAASKVYSLREWQVLVAGSPRERRRELLADYSAGKIAVDPRR